MDEHADKATGGVLMVGSVPLADAKTVFARVSNTLPGRVLAIPDGETGKRSLFIASQFQAFPPEVIVRRPGLPECNEPLKATYTIDSIKPTGYDDVALASYSDFLDLRKQGIIEPGVRFQVSLPTPFNVLTGLCKPEIRPQLEALYEQRFVSSLKRIVDCVPHDDLVI